MKYMKMCKVIEANTRLDQQKNGTRLSYRLPALSFTHLSVHLLPPVVTSPGATLQCLPGRARLSPLGCGFFLSTKRRRNDQVFGGFLVGFFVGIFRQSDRKPPPKIGPQQKGSCLAFGNGYFNKNESRLVKYRNLARGF